MRKQKEYKLTETGKIPIEWELLRLDALLSLEYGKGLPERERTGGRYPVIGSSGIVGYHHKALVKGPGLVIGRKGTIGAISRIKSDFWPIDTTYYVKTLVKDIDLKWLFYALIKLNLPKLNLSDVVPGLKRELVHSLKLPLPPLPEQQRIAEILLTVDEAIEKVDEALKKTHRLKKGLMQELLTNGIGHKEFNDTEIGRIPKEWEIKKINDISLEIHRYPTYYNIEYINNGIKEVRGELIKESGELEVDIAKYRCISHETSEKFPKTIVKKGDFVLSVRGTMGKIAIVPESLEGANITANLIRISLDRAKCYSSFYKYVFLSEKFQKTLNLLSSQTTIKTIQAPKLKSIKLPLPPLSEQQKIAEILSTVDSRMEMLRKRKGKIERIKKGLMNDLLTGRKRVKLDS